MAFLRKGSGWLVGLGLCAACGSSDDAGIGQSDGSAGSGTGGSGATASGGSSGTGGGGSSGSAGSTAGSAGSGGVECNGSHPLLDGGARFCEPGQCRCESSDLCFAQDRAADCCDGQLECFTEDGGVECNGSHPLVDGSARYCEDGACYCEANDTCFPAGIASVCCGSGATCF